jgi:hypothetical protein
MSASPSWLTIVLIALVVAAAVAAIIHFTSKD